MRYGDDSKIAARSIWRSNTLRAEAERLKPDFELACANPTKEELLGVLIMAAPTYGIPDRPPEEWGAIFSAYLDALAAVPILAVRDGFLRWNKGEMYPNDVGRHAFFPKPAELLKMATEKRAELYRGLGRIRQALLMTPPRPPPPPKTKEEREEVARIAEEVRRYGFKGMPRDPKAPAESQGQVADRLRAAAPPIEERRDWPREAI